MTEIFFYILLDNWALDMLKLSLLQNDQVKLMWQQVSHTTDNKAVPLHALIPLYALFFLLHFVFPRACMWNDALQ